MKTWKKLISDGLPMRFFSFLVLTIANIIFYIWDVLVLGIRIRGRKNLKSLRGKGYVLISNHCLFIEPGFISHAIFPRHPYFSIMEQTFVNPLAEWGLRLLRGFPIPRRRGLERIKPEITRVLKKGGVVHFFPEGHLTHFNQDPHPFKKGAFVTAIENQVPILPVASVIRPRKFRGKPLWKFLFQLTMVISEPIIPPSCPESREELLKAASLMAHEGHRIIRASIDEWTL